MRKSFRDNLCNKIKINKIWLALRYWFFEGLGSGSVKNTGHKDLKNWSTRKIAVLNGPRQANLVLITYASSEGSGEPAHHTSSESRGTFRQKARSLAPLNGWACAVKICNDGMLEDTNSLDRAQIIQKLERYGFTIFLYSEWIGNSVDPHQSAPSGAVWSGSLLFA